MNNRFNSATLYELDYDIDHEKVNMYDQDREQNVNEELDIMMPDGG
jgi:hypothetical protein